MTYLIIIGISLTLFGGFLLLTVFEKSRGLRVAGRVRNYLDARTSRTLFIVSHVDWSAFIKHLVVSGTERVAHDVAHAVLSVVRTIERLLTRAVKKLRERRGVSAPLEDTSESKLFERMLLRMRRTLRSTRGLKKED
ncbi:hypothetical protein KJ819_00340 [Patescibacteria group bacterium]|nr:hypothetical protein [Patescibacteria group bacterium]MBU1501084.1 hypothetical protein [Patescibacteria group bacterium]MBU2081043.1 hypothetical protein [Patescibacteria group bacterium]MBU2124134.1 hypothetical protein [Patescibacteria group bacterium]MBU2194990.1 hypothetical protein [Patescibacteria group bacterium]